MRQTEANECDRRLWAVLTIAVFLLVIALVRVSPDTPPQTVRLTAHGDNLFLVAGDETNDPELEAAVEPQASLTPFFFAPVPVNQAEEPLLMTLPGIGEGLAARIIAFRKIHGPMKNRDDLSRIPGIGSKRMQNLEGKICFD